MKRVLVIFTFLIIAASLPMMIPCDNKIYAVSGCCKVRTSLNERWSKIGLSFGQCKERNGREDGDNIYDQIGFVWWDTRCR